MNINMGQLIRKRREELNITQEELAEEIDVDVRTIRRVEKNERAGKGTVKAIYEALNITIQKSGKDKIRTPQKAIRVPNIQSSHDLAHVLINAEHVEMTSHIHDDFEEWLVDNFLEKCEEICGIWEEGAPKQNKVLLGILQNELDKLHKRSIWVSGSCTDSLVNEFKVASLTIFKN